MIKKQIEPTPGPGSYETNHSSVVSTEVTRKLINGKAMTSKGKLSTTPSSNPHLAFTNSSVQKLGMHRIGNFSIPSIPSRYLTPVLSFELHEKDQAGLLKDHQGYHEDGSIESVLVAKMARLTNDGSSLGPGSYNVNDSHKA